MAQNVGPITGSPGRHTVHRQLQTTNPKFGNHEVPLSIFEVVGAMAVLC